MTPQYRIEQYLDAIRGAWLGESPLPAHPDEPVWRIEKFLAAILSAVKGDSPVVVCPDPVWRLEEFGRAIYDAITSASPAWPCPTPASSLEVFLHAIYAMVVDGTEEGTPTPSWDIESWLVDVYNAAKEGSGEEKTVSGVLIHITDALAKAALSVLASIEPIQDLHGYANPWPAGGGKNILPDISRNSSGYDVSVSFVGNTATLTGLANSSGGRNVFRSEYFSLAAGTYYFKKFNESDVKPSVYLQNGTSIVSADANGMFTLSADTTQMNIGLNVTSGTDYNYTGTFLISRENVAEYSPYSNICPITGLTGLSVYRTRKNLVDPSKKAIATGSTTTARWYKDDAGFLLHGGQEYALSSNISTDATYLVYIYDIDGTQLAYGKWTATYTPSADVYVYFQYYESGGAHLADAELQLELGSATTYEPYNGNTYNVDWSTQAGTVYSGTVDVVSGELTVDMVNIPSYNGETINEPWLSSMDAYAAGTTPTIGAQVVYALATPITYQLTPQEVQMLLGENNVWSSSGDTVSVTYYAEGNANPLQSLNILLGGNYSNPKTADDVSDREALEIILGGNK